MTHGGRVIAVIPARGGSKGIPRKNLVLVGGRPLLWWTLDQCRRTPEISVTYVSTDDEEIARLAAQEGAEVIRRPPEISGDVASSEAALLHALDIVETTSGTDSELIVFPQATSPLRHPEDLTRAIELMRSSQADSLFSCHIAEHICLWEVQDGLCHPLTYDYRNRKPRQLEVKRYVENGSFYLVRPSHLKRTGCRLGGHIEMYVLEPWKGLQIDAPDDVYMVECFIDRVRPALK